MIFYKIYDAEFIFTIKIFIFVANLFDLRFLDETNLAEQRLKKLNLTL